MSCTKGFISPRPPPLNTVEEAILSAIQTFKNLQTVALLPTTYHEDLFTRALVELKSCHLLADLRVNSSCMDDVRAPILAELARLARLTLCDPTRAILQLLLDWLERLSSSLRDLHLKVSISTMLWRIRTSFELI